MLGLYVCEFKREGRFYKMIADKYSIERSLIMISVIVPVYEEEKYLGYCLDSLLNQTYKNIEIIIVDDASKDGSINIINDYAKKDSRIKCFFNEENMGAGPTRNIGISNAKGEYITFVDCDDWIDKDYLNTMYHEIEMDPDIDLIVVGSYTYDGKSYKKTSLEEKLYKTGKAYVTDMMKGEVPNSGGNHSKLYSKRVVDNVRYRSYRCAQDGLFSRECLMYINKAKTVAYSGYYYRTYQEIRHETRAAKTPEFYEKQVECSALTVQAAEKALKKFHINNEECKEYVRKFKWTEFEILYRRILFDVYIKMSVKRKISCIKMLLYRFSPPNMLAYVDVKNKGLLQQAFRKNSFGLFYLWMLRQPNSFQYILYANLFPKNTYRGKVVRNIYNFLKRG